MVREEFGAALRAEDLRHAPAEQGDSEGTDEQVPRLDGDCAEGVRRNRDSMNTFILTSSKECNILMKNG